MSPISFCLKKFNSNPGFRQETLVEAMGTGMFKAKTFSELFPEEAKAEAEEGEGEEEEEEEEEEAEEEEEEEAEAEESQWQAGSGWCARCRQGRRVELGRDAGTAEGGRQQAPSDRRGWRRGHTSCEERQEKLSYASRRKLRQENRTAPAECAAPFSDYKSVN